MKRVCLLLGLLLIALPFALFAQSEGQVASLQYFDDPTQITITDASGNPITDITYGMDIPVGATIQTGNSTAEIQLQPNGSILKLAANTGFTIQTLQGQGGAPSNNFAVLAGKLRSIAASTGVNNYSFQTPTAVCGIRGTDFSLDVVPGKADAVGVLTGEVNFINTKTGQSINVGAGMIADTFASTFQAIQMSADQINSLFKQMSFQKLNPDSVPGHSAEVQQQQASQPPPPPPAAPAAPAQAAAPKQPSFMDPIFNWMRDYLGMQIGTLTVNGTTYSQAVLQPQFALGKLKVALYLPVIYQNDLFNPQDWYHPAGNDEWDFGTSASFGSDTLGRVSDAFADFMLKIRYVEWGSQLSDPFYFKIGNLEDMTIGHGLLMYNYANDEDFPALRRIGLNMGLDLGGFGFEVVDNDLSRIPDYFANISDPANPQVMGGRVYVRPFGGFKLAFGASSILDLNPAAQLVAAGLPSYGNPIFWTGGLDLDLPIIKTDPFTIVAFGDVGGLVPIFRESFTAGGTVIPTGPYFNAILDTSSGTTQFRNWGAAAGLLGNLFGFGFRLEYRDFNGTFQPAMFNNTYDRTRTQLVTNLYNYLSDPTAAQYNSTTMGIYGQGGYTFGKLASFEAGYFWPWDPVNGPGSDDFLHLRLALNKGIIPGFAISGSLSYDRTNFIPTLLDGTAKNLTLFDANTTMKGEIDYPVAPTLDLALLVSTSIVTDPATGQPVIDAATNLPKVNPTFSIETRVHF